MGWKMDICFNFNCSSYALFVLPGRLWLGLTCLGWESNHYVLLFPWLGAITVFAMYWVEVWCSCLFAFVLWSFFDILSSYRNSILYIYIDKSMIPLSIIFWYVYKYVDSLEVSLWRRSKLILHRCTNLQYVNWHRTSAAPHPPQLSMP